MLGVARDPNGPGTRTRACRRVLVTDTTTEEVVELLERLGPQFDLKPVLFPCLDHSVLTISRYREQLEAWYHVMLPSHEVVELLIDKIAFCRHANQAGLPIPETYFLLSRHDAERAATQLTFPCLIKPRIRSRRWYNHTHLKALKAHDAGEFLDLYDQYARLADGLIAQQWVPGPDACLFSCNCYFDREGGPVASFVSRKIRQWPPETGETSLGQACRDPVVERETFRLFRSVGYRGLGYVELKRNPLTGEYFILEANIGRPTARSALAEASGVELLWTMYCDAAGLPRPPQRKQSETELKWISLRRDILSALHYWRRGDLSLRGWWQSWRGPKVYALLSRSDPAPFFADLIRALRLFARREERRKRAREVRIRNPGRAS